MAGSSDREGCCDIDAGEARVLAGDWTKGGFWLDWRGEVGGDGGVDQISRMRRPYGRSFGDCAICDRIALGGGRFAVV